MNPMEEVELYKKNENNLYSFFNSKKLNYLEEKKKQYSFDFVKCVPLADDDPLFHMQKIEENSEKDKKKLILTNIPTKETITSAEEEDISMKTDLPPVNILELMDKFEKKGLRWVKKKSPKNSKKL